MAYVIQSVKSQRNVSLYEFEGIVKNDTKRKNKAICDSRLDAGIIDDISIRFIDYLRVTHYY